MIEIEYLVKGLHAMSRAYRVNPMAGHLGAAVMAGYFITEQHPNLEVGVYSGIKASLDRIIHGESGFSPNKDAPLTVAGMFEPYAKEQAEKGLTDDGVVALTDTTFPCQ